MTTPDFKINETVTPSDDARRKWLMSLGEDALRDVLCLAQRGARITVGEVRIYSPHTGKEYIDAYGDLADYLEVLNAV